MMWAKLVKGEIIEMEMSQNLLIMRALLRDQVNRYDYFLARLCRSLLFDWTMVLIDIDLDRMHLEMISPVDPGPSPRHQL